MVELVIEGVLRVFAEGDLLTKLTLGSLDRLTEVCRQDPDGPKIEKEGGVHDVIEDAEDQDEAGNPVNTQPGELEADDRQKAGSEEHEHRGRHNPVEHSGRPGVPDHLVRNAGRRIDRRCITVSNLRLPHNHVDGVKNDKGDARPECRRQQSVGETNENLLTPWVSAYLKQFHLRPRTSDESPDRHMPMHGPTRSHVDACRRRFACLTASRY